MIDLLAAVQGEKALENGIERAEPLVSGVGALVGSGPFEESGGVVGADDVEEVFRAQAGGGVFVGAAGEGGDRALQVLFGGWAWVLSEHMV